MAASTVNFALQVDLIWKTPKAKIKLDDQSDFQIAPVNPQQILAYSWYIFKSFIKSFFQIQNTIRLSWDIDDCRFDHYLNSQHQKEKSD